MSDINLGILEKLIERSEKFTITRGLIKIPSYMSPDLLLPSDSSTLFIDPSNLVEVNSSRYLNKSNEGLVIPSPAEFNYFLDAVVLIRHGVTNWNKERRVQGFSNTPLSLSGILDIVEEAEGASRTLPEIGYVIASHMIRAIWTAELYLYPYSQHRGIKAQQIHIDPNLAEYDFGRYEGRFSADLLKDEAHNQWNRSPFSYNNGSPPHDGESSFDFLNRVNAGICNLFQQIQERGVNGLLVTHSKVFTALLYLMRLSGTYGTEVSLEEIKSLENMFNFYPDGRYIKIPNGIVSIDWDSLTFDKVLVP